MKSEFDELKRFAIADVLSVSGKEKTTSTIEKHIDNIIDVAIAREQNQQTKVDALTLQVAEMKSRLNDAYTDGQSAMYAARQSKVDELQKRVDSTLKVVQSMRNEVKHGHLSDDESQTLSSYANDLEQALKGGSND